MCSWDTDFNERHFLKYDWEFMKSTTQPWDSCKQKQQKKKVQYQTWRYKQYWIEDVEDEAARYEEKWYNSE